METLLQMCRGRVHKEPGTDCTVLYDLTLPKDPGGQSGILTSVYWVRVPGMPTKKSDKIKYLIKEYAWFDHLTLRPAKNPMISGSSAGKAVPIWYSHEGLADLIGIPRYLGLSLFGVAQDDRRDQGQPLNASFRVDLKDYQKACTSQCLALIKEWGGSTLIADCGTGKTAMALFMVAAIGRKTAIVCNRTVLMDQWCDAIEKFLGNGHTVTKLQGADSIEKAVKGDIMIASIDTLVSGVPRDLLKPFGLVVVDEMHHLAAATLVHAIPVFPSKYTLGLTATPNRSDGLEHALYWLTGPVGAVYQRVPEITGKTGTVEVRKIVFTKGTQKEIVYFNGTIGFSSMITELSTDAVRNSLLIDILHWCMTNRNRTVVVTSLVQHAKVLKEAMPKEYPTSLMAGNQKDRSAAAKTSMIFATYSMLEEGYDDPTLDTLILATPRSNVQQTVGRIEREAPGKAVPVVFDIVDSFSLFPNMFWKRNKFYQSRGFHVNQFADSFV